MELKESNLFPKLIRNFVGPVLSLIAFLATYYLDPLNFSGNQPLAAIPAFLLSIVILIINQNISTNHEIKKASLYSDRIYEAVKDYLHVTSLGSPEKAMQYINARIPALREVRNTSFNLEEEMERAEEKLYETDSYTFTAQRIALHSSKNLIWKDIGDYLALERFRTIYNLTRSISKQKKSKYKYRLINNNEPHMNFVILEYAEGDREVLFNWDFRGTGQDPTVLISRDRQIIEMFSIHFAHLWRKASNDHDNSAIKSTSTK